MARHIKVFDLAVVGGGLAGLACAVRAAELGCSVVVLERGAEENYPCNSRASGGIFHVAYGDMKLPPQELMARIAAATRGEAREDQVRTVARTAARLIDWLGEHGTRFVRASAIDWHRWTVAPPRPLRPGLAFPGRGVDVVLKRLAARLRALGGTIALGCRVTGIERTSEQLFVLRADGPTGRRPPVTARMVVLADGGFQGEPEMVRRHIAPRPDLIVQRGAGTGCGDGIRMAEALGAAVTRMDRFYGHLLSRDALSNPALWPYPQIDAVASAGIVVDASGCRLADEGRGGVYLANVIAGRDNPAATLAIFDARIWEEAGRQSLYPPNPHVERAGGTVLSALTLSGLAERLALPSGTLERTVRDYNAAIAAGAAQEPPRSGRAVPIAVAPFMAIPLAVGITHTMGGICVDGDMRVLDRDDRPIPGLYAAGATTGGLEGGDAVGYVGGLVKAGVMGLAAAEHAAGSLGRNTRPVPAAAPARRAASYPFLRQTARYGTRAALLLAAVVGIGAASIAYDAAGWAAAAGGLVLGAVSYVVLRSYVELVTLVTEMLLPREP